MSEVEPGCQSTEVEQVGLRAEVEPGNGVPPFPQTSLAVPWWHRILPAHTPCQTLLEALALGQWFAQSLLQVLAPASQHTRAHLLRWALALCPCWGVMADWDFAA